MIQTLDFGQGSKKHQKTKYFANINNKLKRSIRIVFTALTTKLCFGSIRWQTT